MRLSAARPHQAPNVAGIRTSHPSVRSLIATLVLLYPAWAQDPSAASRELAELKAAMKDQQAQINELRSVVAEQQRVIQRLLGTPTTAAAAAVAAPPRVDTAPAQAVKPPEAAPEKAPLSLRLGDAYFTPFGFMDFAAVIRDTNVASGLGTNFAAIPLAGSVNANLRDYRLSAQNSRIGLRLDTAYHGWNILGLVETDFLGYLPGNAAVTSNSGSMRLRQYWVEARRNKLEILAGQSWSLLTPNRRGVSPLAADLFLTQDVDPNLQVGLTWSRDPQIRLTWHFSDRLKAAASWEAGEQYGGGAAGSGAITLPSALESAYGIQINTGNSGYNVTTPNQDIVAKIAWDPVVGGRSLHLEGAGILRRFGFYNPLTGQSFKVAGGGGSLNAGLDIVKGLRVFANQYISDGGGRYIFGQGPDFIIQGDGSPSLVHSYSSVDGLEYQALAATSLFAYYGGAHFGRNVAIDPTSGKPVGYGYEGAPSGHNRSIQELTGGVSHVFWRNPNYGALQLNLQYSWVTRHLWYAAPTQPPSATMKMFYLNFRYTLPGAPPAPATK
jgi:hypothetical protein